MWEMLKRHEVEVLLKAGHRKTEVARMTGVSLRSVKRIAEEEPVVHVDDKAERNQRQIGRPSTVQNFRKQVRKKRARISGTHSRVLNLELQFHYDGESRQH